ncbi:MAG: FKBP-type peptidyl-prolyl cis-trans isomerase [Pseudomonadota bacterium]
MRFSFWLTAGAAALMLAACGEKSGGGEAAATAAETSEEAPAAAGEGPEIGEIVGNVAEQTASRPTAEELRKLAAENLAASEKFLAENKSKDGVVVTESGLQYIVLTEGDKDGASPAPSDIVDMHFSATFKDGTEFLSSRAQGAAARFPLNEFLPGGIEGVQLMTEGDRYRFFMPPALAFGERGAGPVPPNEAVIFDIELLNVLNPEKNLEAAEKFLEENAKKDGVKVTDSGLQYEVISEGAGDGERPNEASSVKVHYVGTLVNGTEFDSSIARGQPAEFPLNGVISGWTEGLQLMSVGDKFRFFIHPKLAYGANPRPGGAIGPNDALIFEVELLEVK